MANDGMVICEYLWGTFYVVWLVWALWAKPVRTREDAGSRLSYVFPTVLAYVLMFSRYVSNGWLRMQIFPDDRWLQLLGIGITIAGLGFAVWARMYLGGNWSSAVTVKIGHELVRSGPYRWVRHPIYSGLILALLGTAVENRQVRGIVAVILLYTGFAIKSRIEERAMTNTFGAEYDEYSRNTGRILPRFH
jgi:protein-S-isoprenylcysteine O-methyltransferase